MKKSSFIICLTVIITGIIYSGFAIAADPDCTVETVSGTKVTLDCGSGANDVSAGKAVKANGSACTVESVSGTKVVLDCGTGAKDLTAGGAVKVKSSAKKKTIEGC